MPVVNLPIALLNERLGETVEPDALVEHLQHLGCDVEGYETMHRYRCTVCGAIHEVASKEEAPVRCDECGTEYRERQDALSEIDPVEVIRMELLPVRPDMFDPGGLARALRNYLSFDLTPPRYELATGDYSITVAEGLDDKGACYRPHIAGCVVRGIELDDTRIKVVMKLQENLHWAIGRDRKFASIGVYDLSKVQGTALRYRPVGPGELTFAPLGYAADQQVTPAAVLAEHPKGKAFAHLLEDFTRYPLLEDEAGGVMSMPPIINSEHTCVTHDTTAFFIDVTGLSARTVEKTLNILATSLAELNPGVSLEAVTITGPGAETRTTPRFESHEMTLDPDHAAKLIGVELSRDDVTGLLHRMGHEVETAGERLHVKAPPYRNDLLHEVDLIEDVAIAYGFHNVPPTLVPTLTVGRGLPIEETCGHVRRILSGLGFLETIALPITSPEQTFDALRLPRADAALEIANPIHDDSGTPLGILRTNLLSGLLGCLARYRGAELPQKLYEVGDVTHRDPVSETGAHETRRAAAVMIGTRVGFADARSLAEAVVREMGATLEAKAETYPFYLEGRSAKLIAVRGNERTTIGHFGEVHPEVLERFGLGYSVAALEVDVRGLVGHAGGEREKKGLRVSDGNRAFL